MLNKVGIGPAMMVVSWSIKRYPMLPFTPCSGAANMRSVHTVGSIHAQRASMSPACIAPAGTCRRSGFRLFGLHAFHLPALPSLHAHYRRFLATMGALTPAQALAALRLLRSLNTALVPPGRSPCFTCTAFRPFRLQPPDSPRRRFRTLPLSAPGFPQVTGGLDFALGSKARQSVRPYRVRQPTDGSFTSRCSGLHLAVTP